MQSVLGFGCWESGHRYDDDGGDDDGDDDDGNDDDGGDDSHIFGRCVINEGSPVGEEEKGRG